MSQQQAFAKFEQGQPVPPDGAAGGKAHSHPSRTRREAARAADELTTSRRVRGGGAAN